jgi:hypothetical protein
VRDRQASCPEPSGCRRPTQPQRCE